MIFTRTKIEADKLAHSAVLGKRTPFLPAPVSAAAKFGALTMGVDGWIRIAGCEVLHGDVPQNAREHTMANFRAGRLQVLVRLSRVARPWLLDSLEPPTHPLHPMLMLRVGCIVDCDGRGGARSGRQRRRARHSDLGTDPLFGFRFRLTALLNPRVLNAML
jgi:hypothetical protein